MAQLQPRFGLGISREIDLYLARPGENAGDIEIGDSKAIPMRVSSVSDRRIKHLKRDAESTLGLVRRSGIAPVLGTDPVQEHGERRPSDLGHPQKLHCQARASSARRCG